MNDCSSGANLEGECIHADQSHVPVLARAEMSAIARGRLELHCRTEAHTCDNGYSWTTMGPGSLLSSTLLTDSSLQDKGYTRNCQVSIRTGHL
jgi:hypothetical protein